MPPSNDIEKHGSDLVGLGAELDCNESPPLLPPRSPPSHQTAETQRVKKAFLLLSPWKQGLTN